MELLDEFFGQSETKVKRELIIFVNDDICNGAIAFHKHSTAAKSIQSGKEIWEVESNKGTVSTIILDTLM